LAQTPIDFAAVGRVSACAELKDIRLTEVSAKCDLEVSGPLTPEVSNNCSVILHNDTVLNVACEYRFAGNSPSKPKLVEIVITYLVSYALSAPGPLTDGDIAHFATGNGTLHTWPFVREFLYTLTSRMGVAPFKLGVMHFVPMPVKTQKETTDQVAAEEPSAAPTT
jgi:hypothetical protein